MVDVVVTNNSSPVVGLSADKFQLTEDGHPQHITVFEEHRPGDAPYISKAPALPAHIYSNFPQFSVAGAASVLLLDALNTPLSDQVYVREQMLEYLKNIPLGTRVAVFTLASRLRMVEGFTTDSSVIHQALSSKDSTQQSVLLDSAADRQLFSTADSLSNLGATQNAIDSMKQFQADLQAFQTDLRVRMTLDAMKQLALYLNVIPGRKNLIWFSGSFPIAIDPDAALQSPFAVMRNYADDLRKTDEMLSAARVAVYPIDARGLMTLPSSLASNDYSTASLGPSAALPGGGAGGSRGSAASGSGLSAEAQADREFLQQTMQEHASMRQIAEDTGGEAFVNTNGLKEALAKAVDNGSHYYTIGYAPEDDKHDGAFRRIQIKLDGGYHTAYRRGYYADDPGKAAINSQTPNNELSAAILHGAPQISQILFKVRVLPADDPAVRAEKISSHPAGAMAKDLKGRVERYLIDYVVDAHHFAFSNAPDGAHHAHVEFAVIAYDADGRRLNYADSDIGMNLPPARFEQIMRAGLSVRQEIDLPAQPIYLRVIVHDLDNAAIGTTEIPVVVPKG